MSTKRYTSVQTDKGRVIYDNTAQRYVSNSVVEGAAPTVTADINRAEVWTANDEGSREIFRLVLKALNKQSWLTAK